MLIPVPPDVVWGSENGRYQGFFVTRLAQVPSSLPIGSPQPTWEDQKLCFKEVEGVSHSLVLSLRTV